MNKPITQPTPEDEKLLNDILENSRSTVTLRGKTIKLAWLKRGTMRLVSKIVLAEGNDDKASCQAAAAIRLNDFWKIKFFWWFVWRWYYYVRQYGDDELLPLVSEGKKKIPFRDYLTVTISLTAMKDTMMQMTKKEVNAILQEQATDKPGNSPKSDPG